MADPLVTSGTGTLFSGLAQAGGNIYAAGLANEQAKKDRKDKRNMFNKENLMSVNQYNMNQSRLAGLGAQFSGMAGAQRAQGMANLGDYNTWLQANPGGTQEAYGLAKANAMQTANATAATNLQGLDNTYGTLNAADYQLGAPASGPKGLGAYVAELDPSNLF